MNARALSCVVGLALVATGVFAASASADSLVYIRDSNVWLSNPDGSGAFQVTLDGTAGAPYDSPSQADDGTIVAVRATPGQRRQIYRMSQSGGLLNAPINTPAPGTGAIDARVSPDGRYVAYWFVTVVNDPGCPFCFPSTASRALITRSNSFTGPDEAGLTPNTGTNPSWMSNDMLYLAQGGASETYFYRLGTAAGQHWFNDGDTFLNAFETLLDGDAARTGDRIAIVRGDNQETLVAYTMSGPPPALPTPVCGWDQPNGKFVAPTWSSNGGTLAWQENDGIWSADVGSGLACAGSVLRIPGAAAPDFGPAAIHPGPRPPCGNPGNPAACPAPPPPCTTRCAPPPPGVTLKDRLNALLAAEAKALGRLKLGGLVKRGRKLGFNAPGAGTLAVKLAKKSTVLASAKHVYTAAGKGTVSLKLSKTGKKALRRARSAKLTLKVSFTPRGATATTVKRSFTLTR